VNLVLHAVLIMVVHVDLSVLKPSEVSTLGVVTNRDVERFLIELHMAFIVPHDGLFNERNHTFGQLAVLEGIFAVVYNVFLLGVEVLHSHITSC